MVFTFNGTGLKMVCASCACAKHPMVIVHTKKSNLCMVGNLVSI